MPQRKKNQNFLRKKAFRQTFPPIFLFEKEDTFILGICGREEEERGKSEEEEEAEIFRRFLPLPRSLFSSIPPPPHAQRRETRFSFPFWHAKDSLATTWLSLVSERGGEGEYGVGVGGIYFVPPLPFHKADRSYGQFFLSSFLLLFRSRAQQM